MTIISNSIVLIINRITIITSIIITAGIIIFQFCHSFGRGVSLACLENNQENSAVAAWLQENGGFFKWNLIPQ